MVQQKKYKLLQYGTNTKRYYEMKKGNIGSFSILVSLDVVTIEMFIYSFYLMQ